MLLGQGGLILLFNIFYHLDRCLGYGIGRGTFLATYQISRLHKIFKSVSGGNAFTIRPLAKGLNIDPAAVFFLKDSAEDLPGTGIREYLT